MGIADLVPGVIALLVASAVLGGIAGLLTLMPARLRSIALTTAALTVVIGLLENQIENVITLPDAFVLALVFGLGYGAATLSRSAQTYIRMGIGLIVGAVAGVVLALLVDGGATAAGGFLRGAGSVPLILNSWVGSSLVPFAIIFGLTGLVGGLVTHASSSIHNGMVFFVTGLLIIGVLNWQSAMTVLASVITAGLLAGALWVIPPVGERVEGEYAERPRWERRNVQSLALLVVVAILIVAPFFLGQYITDVLNLVGLYIIMGIGLNVVVGYAGLLDLGYVAFFAIGAYTVGILTTPSLVTCGGVEARNITPDMVASTCTGVLTFWQAWPIAIGVSALGGIMLGIPVLRLRGDYLAIVTLGFGEIIRLIVKFDDFKPLFGAAQGIPNIPRPVLDFTALNPAWRFELSGAVGIYYLVLVGIVITAYVATRLVGSRLGRAWRALRADEDVAQAMGINLTRTKLFAFAIGAAFAGMGGAVAGSRLYGAYPDSYTLLVSINVLSLIIIGGLGSIPGVIVGSLILIGLPEVLRELEDYRLMAFGVLLVVVMLIKPQGLIPQTISRLSEEVEERRVRGAQS